MSARVLLLAMGLSAAACAPLTAQSFFSSAGLGLPIEAVDARARALGNVGLGLSGGTLLPSDPAAAARLRLPTGVLVAQPSWADASDGAQNSYFRGTRFPLLAAAYPGFGGIFSVQFASIIDQDFVGERESTVMLGGTPVVARDLFQQNGSVSSMNVGYARMLTEETSVGLSVGRYTGTFGRTFSRTVESGVGGAVQDYVSIGSWAYSGYLVTGGVATRLVDLVNVSASATWSSPRCWIARAAPTAWGTWVPSGDEIDTNLIGSTKEKCTGIWRPTALSRALPNMLCIMSVHDTPWYKAMPKSR